MTSGAHASINRTARLIGVLYLALAPLGFFGIVYVPSALFVPGDSAATSSNILASETMFRGGTASHLIGQLVFVFLVLALYRLLKRVNEDHAILMTVLALLSVPVAFLNEAHHLAVLHLLNGTYAGAFTQAQLDALTMLLLDLRQSGILVNQVFWGLWLFPLGLLVYRSGFLPRLLGVLLMIAGAGYLVDVGTELMVPGLPTISWFTFVGELVFPLWLLIKGVDVERWREGAVA